MGRVFRDLLAAKQAEIQRLESRVRELIEQQNGKTPA
jgi:hypothetical protein